MDFLSTVLFLLRFILEIYCLFSEMHFNKTFGTNLNILSESNCSMNIEVMDL